MINKRIERKSAVAENYLKKNLLFDAKLLRMMNLNERAEIQEEICRKM